MSDTNSAQIHATGEVTGFIPAPGTFWAKIPRGGIHRFDSRAPSDRTPAPCPANGKKREGTPSFSCRNIPTSQANGKNNGRTIANAHAGSVVVAQNHAIP